MTTQQYQQASEHFLARAWRGPPKRAGVLLPQMLKAVAEQRGWEHSGYRHHLVAVSRVRSETGDRNIRCLFSVASALHENTMQAFEVAESLDDVQALLNQTSYWPRFAPPNSEIASLDAGGVQN